MPFVLYSQPTGSVGDDEEIGKMADEAYRRYAEIMRDVELMIDDHSRIPSLCCQTAARILPTEDGKADEAGCAAVRRQQTDGAASKLSLLVPTAGPFFTRLPLEAAFGYQDGRRNISSRRFVAPSFNDVRLVLNSAQLMAVTGGVLQLATFDGDVTLYEDGGSLEPSSPIVPRLLGRRPSLPRPPPAPMLGLRWRRG